MLDHEVFLARVPWDAAYSASENVVNRNLDHRNLDLSTSALRLS
jgi:hypothetical protein